MNGDQSPDTPPTGWRFNPGDTITPQSTVPAPMMAPPSAEQPIPAPAPIPTSPAEMPQPSPMLVPQAPEQPMYASQTEPLPDADDTTIAWSASEYVAHQKTFAWYAALALVAVVLAGVTYLATKDMISTVSIIIIAAVFGMYGARKPRVLDYKLDVGGLMIAHKFYAYGNFRSFAVMKDGAFSSIALMPLRRFMPLLTIYYSPEDEERIIELLADRLPMEQRNRDAIDSLMHKIRF